MARIEEGVLQHFVNGMTLNAEDYERLLETFRVAINDIEDKLGFLNPEGIQEFQTQIDDLNSTINQGVADVQEAAVETVDARAGYPTLKERLDAFVALFINLDDYKPDANGDWTAAFEAAATKAVAEDKYLRLGVKTYQLTASLFSALPLQVPYIVGAGIQQSKLKLIGNVSFLVLNDFLLQDLAIEPDYMVTSAEDSTGHLFTSTGALDQLIVRNVHYLNVNPITDGSSRGKGLFSFAASNVVVDNVKTRGTRNAFTLRSAYGMSASNISVRKVKIENTQSGFYLTGGNPTVPGLTESDFITDVTFSDISLLNTAVQQTNANQINGADLFMFERVRNAKFSNIMSERPVERTGYMNCCENVVLDNAIHKYAEGWKFCGYIDTPTGISYIADGFMATNMYFDEGEDGATRGMMLYDCRNVSVNGFTINGGTDNASTFSTGFVIERYTDNIRLANIKAKNLLRGLIEFNMVYSTTFTAQVNNFTIDGAEVINPVLVSTYPVIRATIDPAFPVSTYLFNDIKILNVQAKQLYSTVSGTPSDFKGYYADSRLSALIDINQVNKLRTRNNRVEGYSNASAWLKIGPNSRDVIVNERMSLGDINTIPPGLYLSGGSRIEHYHEERSKGGAFQGRLIALADYTDDYATMDMANASQYSVEGAIKLAVGLDKLLPWPANAKSGFGTIAASNGDYITFLAAGGVVTKINGSANSDVANTAGKFAVYFSGSSLYFRNRLAVDVFVTVDYKVTVRV